MARGVARPARGGAAAGAQRPPPSAVRPDRAEVDLGVYVHERPGPATAWAAGGMAGAPALLSGPDVRRGAPRHGIRWDPGPAVRRVLLAGDETACPVIRNIAAVTAGDPGLHRDVLLEAGEAEDAAALRAALPGARCHPCSAAVGSPAGRRRPVRPPRSAADAVRLGEGFLARPAAEGTRVAGIRDGLRAAGAPPRRIHSRGYRHDRVRTS